MHIKKEISMSRPKRLRRVCFLPEHTSFGVKDVILEGVETITMTVEEYETIRLIDLDGFDQEKAAMTLDISRGTLQRIYHKAKRKVAEMLVCGKQLIIDKGDYRMCDHPEHEHVRPCQNNEQDAKKE